MLSALSNMAGDAVKALDGQEESWERLQVFLRTDSEREVLNINGASACTVFSNVACDLVRGTDCSHACASDTVEHCSRDGSSSWDGGTQSLARDRVDL